MRCDDHSSSPGLATGIERPTRGFIDSCRLRSRKGSPLLRARSASRASSGLLFGLAPRGVFRAGSIADAAVGSYPTFSPLPSSRSIGRCPRGFPLVYHRGTPRRRSILCGTFREPHHRLEAVSGSPGVTRRVALLCLRKVVSGLSSRPTCLRRADQRSSSSPAILIIPCISNIALAFTPRQSGRITARNWDLRLPQ